jgi:hypothetical protein
MAQDASPKNLTKTREEEKPMADRDVRAKIKAKEKLLEQDFHTLMDYVDEAFKEEELDTDHPRLETLEIFRGQTYWEFCDVNPRNVSGLLTLAIDSIEDAQKFRVNGDSAAQIQPILRAAVYSLMAVYTAMCLQDAKKAKKQ